MPVLRLSNIRKRFSDVVALDDVSLDLREGSIHAVLGENGAGKTTLMRVAYGIVAPDHGTVAVNGRKLSLNSPRDALLAGIGMVHQHFSHVPSMTVAENVALGGHGLFEPRRAVALVRRVAQEAGLALDPLARAADLPVGAQQRLELVKLLATGARVLILDEPTAVLTPAEAAELLRWLRQFADRGGSIALVTHKVREALAVADEITVLRLGRVHAQGPARDFSEARLLEVMFPASPDEEQQSAVQRSTAERGPVIVAADRITILGASGGPCILSASFQLHSREVLGIIGVEGSGYAELLRTLAGLRPVDAGTLTHPDDTGFVPEDRHRDGLILDFSVTENVALRGAGARTGLFRLMEFDRITCEIITSFGVRPGSERVLMRTLSGGNQQRVVLGRELRNRPVLLVAENPTRGLDAQATNAVHARLRRHAAEGAAVVLYSNDIDEVLGLASRVLVVHGHHVLEVPLDRDAIGRAMVGAA